MSNAYVSLEYPGCIHVTVENATSARSAVQLARVAATKHYGQSVSHYVSSGSSHHDGQIDYSFVFSAPTN